MVLESSERPKGIIEFLKVAFEKLKIITKTRLDLFSLEKEVNSGISGWLSRFLPFAKLLGFKPKESDEAKGSKASSSIDSNKLRSAAEVHINSGSNGSEIRKAYIEASKTAPGKVPPSTIMKHVQEAAAYHNVKNVRALQIIMLCFANFESGFGARSINYNEKKGTGSCASGIFQFMPHVDRGKRNKKGNVVGGFREKLPKKYFSETERDRNNPVPVFDPRVNTWMAVDLLLSNARSIGVNLDSLTSIEAIKKAVLRLYIAHNSGAGNVKAVEMAQVGDYSLIEEKTNGDKSHWLWKRPKNTLHVLNYFNQAVKDVDGAQLNT